MADFDDIEADPLFGDQRPSSTTGTLTDFLLARIAWDQENRFGYDGWCGEWRCQNDAEQEAGRARVLAECEAKRRIVEIHQETLGLGDQIGATWDVLHVLASVYADHPDFREEWRA